MRLVFGVACDGPSYPDFPGNADGVFGAAVVGPLGLINAIEIQLGLTAPQPAQTARIACYVAKMRAALDAQPTLFFASSANLDPWATASTLLAWRDELVLSGWEEAEVGSERLDGLALIAKAGAALPPGLPDRIVTILRNLGDGASLSIAAIELVEPAALLSPHWRRLIDALARCGVAIVEPVDPAATASGDLGRVQRFLAEATVEPMTGDGSFTFVRSDTALAGAEAVAEWLAHGTEEELHGTVVISLGGDTALLDLALQARGLPALGQSAASPWRGALQVLPLAIAAAWAPFDARAMLDLLILPRPPVPRRIARKLANALSREPGTGGAQWATAWAAIEADVEAQVAAEELTRTKADAHLKEWRAWTTGGLHKRSEGMPAASAKAIAGRVARWAIESDAGNENALLLAVAGAANALIEAIELIGMETLPPLLVERMIDQVLAEGAQNPDHVATAGGLRCVRHPAAIWDEAPRLIWWDFKGPGDRVPRSPWSHVEVEALRAVGCHLETAADAARRIGWSYSNAVRHAGERLMFVTPALSGADEATSHPLAHQLEPIVAPARHLITWQAERLLAEAKHGLLGRDMFREAIAIVEPPHQKSTWAVPPGVRAKLAGRVESATSFERLSECQMRWILIDVLRLSRGRAAEIPGTDQLLGNLAHELANQVLQPGDAIDPAQILADVEASFEDMVSAIATPLQRPEHAGELAAARARVPLALEKLAQLLKAMGVEVVGTELDRKREFDDGLSVGGRLDLVVRHPTRGLGVIDLKWTRSAKRRLNELSEGRALQLATYGAIADPDSADRADGAYYLLNQRRLIGLEGSFLSDESIRTDRNLDATWAGLVATWRTWRDLALGGALVASGTADAADHIPADLPIAPGKEPCRYCELTGLCRVAAEEI